MILGMPEKLSPKNKQVIIRDVRKSGKSVSQNQHPSDINVSRSTIWRTLKIALMLNIQRDKRSFMEGTSHKSKTYLFAPKCINRIVDI